MPPQIYLDCKLRSRGYSTKRYKALRSAYYNKPTPLQQESYDLHLIGLVRQNNVQAFQEIIKSGVSQNPSNSHAESFVHMVSRRGNAALLKILLENGASVQISDDYGRNPLHDACWAAEPAFDVVKMILERDVRLFHMIDARGHSPLNYVRKDHWAEWVEFLDAHMDVYWPQQDAQSEQEPPSLVSEEPNTRPLADPVNVLDLQLVKMVAGGRMKPYEAVLLDKEGEDDGTIGTIDDDSSSYYSSDDEDQSYYSSDEEEEEDTDDFLAHLPCHSGRG